MSSKAALAVKDPTPASAERRALPVDVPEPFLEAGASALLRLGGSRLDRLGVTSSLAGEGRTTVALALALVMHANYGRRVVLVDMDLDNPKLAARLGARPVPGLGEVVHGERPLEAVVQPVAEGIDLIPAGAPDAFTARTMTDLVRGDLLARIGAASGGAMVIADLPPLLGSVSGPTAAAAFPHLLLVVRAGITPVARVKEAVTGLPGQPAILLNGTRTHLPRWARRLLGS